MGIYILTIALLLIAFAGIAIKIWAQKDGEFGVLAQVKILF